MSTCDEVRLLLVIGRALDGAGEAHVRDCPACRREEPLARALARALVLDAVPAAPPDLSARVLAAAAVPLDLHARRAARPDWRVLVRALGVALLPLPLVLALDALVLQGAYRVLSALLPGALGAYLVFSYAALLALLMALTYAAVPVLAERLRAWPPEESHA